MSLPYTVEPLTTELSWCMQGSGGSELSAAPLPPELLCGVQGVSREEAEWLSLSHNAQAGLSGHSEVSEESEVTRIHTGRLGVLDVHPSSSFPLPHHRVSMGCWGRGRLLPGHGHGRQQGSGASLGLQDETGVAQSDTQHVSSPSPL